MHRERAAYIVMDVQVFNQRVASGGHGFVGGDESCIIEAVEVDPVHYRSRHGDELLAKEAKDD